MKTIFIILLSPLLLATCSDPSNKVEQQQKEVEASYKEFQNEVKIFKSEMREKIRENERSLSNLKNKASSDNTAERELLNLRIAELEAQNVILNEKLDAFSEADESNWESFKKEFNHDMDALGNSIKSVFNDDVKP